LQAIRSEAPRLHGLRLAYAANSAREKRVKALPLLPVYIYKQYDLLQY
jgi:hypothetical protein